MRLEFDPNASNNLPISSPDDKSRFTESLNSGIKAAQAGERKKARSLLMTAVEIDPRSENAWLWLASISEYPEELLVFLNNVLDINPQNERALQWSASTRTLLSKTLVQRGIDAVEDGRNDFAMQCFEQALNHDDRNQMAWLWVASIAETEQQKMEYLQRVLSIDPENETAKAEIQAAVAQSLASRMIEASRLAINDDRENARSLVEAILADFPDNEDAWVLKSHLAEGFDEKAAAWSRVLEINNENALAKAGLESLHSIIASVPAPPAETHEAASDLMEAVEVPSAADSPVEMTPVEESSIDFESDAEVIEAMPENNELSFDHAELVRDPTQELVLPEAFSAPDLANGDDNELGLTSVEDDRAVEIEHQDLQPAKEESWDSPWHGPADADPYRPAETSWDEQQTIDAFSVPHEFFVPSPSDGNGQSRSAVTDDVDEDYGIPMPSSAGFLEVETGPSNDPYATHVERRSEVIEFEPVDEEGGATVLVIDDSSTVRKLIAGKLEESGYRVVCAESGPEGLDLARVARPSLVLLDVAMPKIDGYEVCRMIRNDPETSGIPVIMISGKDAFYDEGLGSAAGASGFITKPFGPEALMKVVEGHLTAV